MAAKVAGSWKVLSPIGFGSLDQVDTTARFTLGTKCRARDAGSTAYGEGEFIYLKGVTSTARGSVVAIKGDYSTELVAARSRSALAVALGAVDATTKYGWYQIRGVGVALCDAGIVDAAGLYIDGTSGRVDDTAVAGDAVIGMRAASTDDTNTCLVNMVYPAVADFDNA